MEDILVHVILDGPDFAVISVILVYHAKFTYTVFLLLNHIYFLHYYLVLYSMIIVLSPIHMISVMSYLKSKIKRNLINF